MFYFMNLMKPQVARNNDSHEEMNPEMSPEIGRRKKYKNANDSHRFRSVQVFICELISWLILGEKFYPILKNFVWTSLVGASLRNTDTPGREGGGGRVLINCMMFPYEVSTCSFFQLNVRKPTLIQF